MALSNSSFDNRLATTIAAWVNSNLADLISSNSALFAKLRMQGNIRVGGHGGSFVEPISFPATGGPTVAGISDPYAALTHVATTNMTGAAFTVAEYGIPVSVTDYDLTAQGSDTTKVALVQAVMEISINRFLETMNADMWATEETSTSAGSRAKLASIRTLLNAGKGSATGGAVPEALAEQLGNRAVASASTQSSVTLVGGIERNAAGAAYWAVPVINTSQTLDLGVLSSLITKTTRGSEQVDLLVMHPDSYDVIVNLLTTGGGSGGQFFTGGSKLADAGYQAIRFAGADIVFDASVPTATYLNGAATLYGYSIFGINTKYLKLRALSMKPQFKEVPDSRLLKTWTGAWRGQITMNSARHHIRHVNVTN